MAGFTFTPLELWRASSLAAETKAVIEAYEQCLSSRDEIGLARLRAAIEVRIDELEDFYARNSKDERSYLFDRQRSKLRKLLSEYDAAIAMLGEQEARAAAEAAVEAGAARAAAGSMYDAALGAGRFAGAASVYGAGATPYGMGSGVGAFSGPGLHAGQLAPPTPLPMGSLLSSGLGGGSAGGGDAGASGGGRQVREIREDSRLTLLELSAWFTQAGAAEMPELSLPVVEKVWGHITRVNLDGRMSIRDLRQWYVSFGKRALQDGLAAGDLDRELVPSRFLTRGRKGAKATPADAASAAGRPLYAWEAAGEGGASALDASGVSSAAPGAAAAGAGAGAGAPPAPATLPHGVLTFRIVLTEEEYRAMAVRRRQLEAEARYVSLQRAEREAREKEKEKERERSGKPDAPGAVLRKGPYEEPATFATHLLRA